MDSRKGIVEALIAQLSFSVEKTDLVNKKKSVCLFLNDKTDVKRLFTSSKRSLRGMNDSVGGILKARFSQG